MKPDKTKEAYSPEQMKDAKKFLDIIANLPPDKRFLVTIATESFVSGMVAQAQLAEAARPSA